MRPTLNIKGLFESEQELLDTVKKRRICYDTEPYYISGKKGDLVQIGFQLNLYGTFSEHRDDATTDSAEHKQVEADVRRLAEALSQTCDPVHMCESTSIDPATLTYSQDRNMRPDVTVRVPIFDRQNFGHPVDERIRNTFSTAIILIESAGVRNKKWTE